MDTIVFQLEHRHPESNSVLSSVYTLLKEHSFIFFRCQVHFLIHTSAQQWIVALKTWRRLLGGVNNVSAQNLTLLHQLVD